MNIAIDSQYSSSKSAGNDNKIKTTEYRTDKPTNTWGSGYTVDIADKVMDNEAYHGHGMTAEDIMQQAQNTDVRVQKDFMIVMSNSVSGEDLQRLKEEGFDPANTDVETYVSMVDKIKVTLAKAGVEIAGYTDNIDTDMIKEVAGNSVNAEALMNKLKKADIPATKENIEEIAKAAEKSLSITGLTEDMIKYMIQNGKQPTVDNLYKSQFSGTDAGRQGKGYYSDTVGNGADFYAKKADTIHWDSIESQIEALVKQSGLDGSKENMEAAKWLVSSGIELNEKNLELLLQLKGLSFPMKENEAFDIVIGAMGNGKSAGSALMTGEAPIAEQAAEYVKEISKISNEAVHEVMEEGQTLNLKNLSAAQKTVQESSQHTAETDNVSLRELEARRQLEEVRLMMTEEANRKLIRSGFSIDIAELSKLVEALKAAEDSMRAALFHGENDIENEQKAALFEKTVAVTKSLPFLPAAVLGKLTDSKEKYTLAYFHEEGARLQKQYRAAQETYEALMTAPRKDLGDSIRKAFRNVDDILEDIELEVNDTNRRAVRILGYNSMEITKENIAAVKEADSQVNGIIRRMTPAATLQMIREQKNPLEMKLEELDEYLTVQDKDLAKDTEKFSKYLQKLDRAGSISEEEREAYIGIYRMFRQIEKTDGAVIGSLVASGAEMNFKNLLSAVRTGKDKNMDIRVDDAYGSLEELLRKNTAIDTQIMTGFTQSGQSTKYYAGLSGEIREELAEHTDIARLSSYGLTETTTIEQFAQDVKEMRMDMAQEKSQNLSSFRQTMKLAQETEAEVIQSLMDYEQPVNADNIQAASLLLMERGELYRQIFGRSGEEKDSSLEALTKAADKAVSELTDEAAAKQSYQELVEEASRTVERMIYEGDTSRIDIKTAKLLCKGLSLAGNLSKEENYELPVTIKGELTSVNLKIYHNQAKTGKVAITFETKQLGKVAAELDVSAKKVSGMVAFEEASGRQDMEQIKDALEKEFAKEQKEAGNERQVFLSLVHTKDLDLNKFGQDKDTLSKDERLSTKELYQTAKVFLTSLKSLE